MANQANIAVYSQPDTNIKLYALPVADAPASVNIILTAFGIFPTFPAASDTRAGTSYGPTGVEFLGTFSAGGSNTYSRGRVVNG